VVVAMIEEPQGAKVVVQLEEESLRLRALMHAMIIYKDS